MCKVRDLDCVRKNPAYPASCARRKVVFVHGCFWHQHAGCIDGRVPASNQSYWLPKLQSNTSRDAQAQIQLKATGWDVLVVWECETKDIARLTATLKAFLHG